MPLNINNISVRKQVLLPVVLICLIMLVAFSIVTKQSAAQRKHNNDVTYNALNHKTNVQQVLENTFNIRINAIYALNDDAAFNRLDAAVADGIKANNLLLDRISQDQQFLAAVNTVRSNSENYQQFIQRELKPFVVKKSSMGVTASEEGAVAANFQATGQALIESIDGLSLAINSDAENQLASVYADYNQMMRGVMILIGSLVVVGLLIAWYLAGRIVQPIIAVRDVLHQLSEGNLTVRAEENGSNEIGALSHDINNTLSRLQQTITSLNRISDEVASASTELTAVMHSAQTNAESELAEIEQVASAVNELSSTAENVSMNAGEADTCAKQSQKMVDEGQSVFVQSEQANRETSGKMSQAADVVLHLREQSEQVSKVIDVIQGISEQTNLLALNAAIEAARAGESGRGFAVVADEVRMLAARTQDSTREIQAIIEDLQAQSVNANQGMQDSLQMLEDSGNLTSLANEVFEGITDAMGVIGDMNAEVATAAEQQSQVTQDINRNVVTMSELVNQNVVGISQSTSASEELAQLADQQRKQLSFFKC
ncbi:methyl-accepting chemotaxis protein [Photobacterium sanctipauli]|uniref:Methyl-accepting chemotaxis protein n=1 Tax=Photobacterium sanctipauli TaxID=1342794 RepID=A0A2T3NN35_9GAMM|nr:methyl-accepting chemotaxis protein [Photobacterium sanctipauli]PSW16910.1 methyl-accepting chemotaxis protein [Photobacterium sanctipauli]